MNIRGNKLWAVFALASLGLALWGSSLALAQTGQQDPKKKQQEEYETPYTEEEYAAYEAATKEPDPVKRQQMMMKFLRDNPKSALNSYVLPAYKQMMRELFEQKKYQPLTVAAEDYLTLDANDLVSVAMLAESYRNLGNHEKYIQYGLRVFNNMPSAADAYNLAKAYEALNNEAKYVEWATKTMEMLPVSNPANLSIHLEILTRFTQMHVEKKEVAQAAACAEKLLPILEKAPKPATVSAAEWKEYVNKESIRAWGLMGQAHYEKERWREAMNAYQKVLTFARRNDLAHYRIGLCQWKLEDVDAAIESFARAYVLKGAVSKTAYDYLEQLYKALHNGTTVGINKVIDAAKKEFGV